MNESITQPSDVLVFKSCRERVSSCERVSSRDTRASFLKTRVSSRETIFSTRARVVTYFWGIPYKWTDTPALWERRRVHSMWRRGSAADRALRALAGLITFVFLDKSFYSQSISFHPGVKKGSGLMGHLAQLPWHSLHWFYHVITWAWGELIIWCVSFSGTIYQEVISYNSANDIPSPVDGNGEINASSSSSSISSGES